MLGLTNRSIFRRPNAFNDVGRNRQHQRPTVVPADIDLCPIAALTDADHLASRIGGDLVRIVGHRNQPNTIISFSSFIESGFKIEVG